MKDQNVSDGNCYWGFAFSELNGKSSDRFEGGEVLCNGLYAEVREMFTEGGSCGTGIAIEGRDL